MSSLAPVVIYATGARATSARLIFQRSALAAVLSLAGWGAHAAQAHPPVTPLPAVTVTATALETVTALSDPTVQGKAAPGMPPSLALGVWTSQPGEAKLAFVQRVALVLERFTREQGVEACGKLMHANAPGDDRWRVALTTNLSQVACLEVHWNDPAFSETAESIHSHPRRSSLALSPIDRAMSPKAEQQSRGGRVNVSPGAFSQLDFANGPGYLVAQQGSPFWHTELLYQEGRGQVVDLGRLPRQSDAALLADVQPDPTIYHRLMPVDPAAAAAWAVQTQTPDPSPVPSSRSSRRSLP